MKLYLLSCQNIQWYSERILPLLPKRRRDSYARSGSKLALGAGLLLAAKLDIHADKDLRFGPQGKPIAAAGKPEFSLSHSGDYVLLGVSDRLIGVDMEQKGRRVSDALRNRVCLPLEKDLDPLRVFTRKECAMKLTGLGFTLPLQQIDTTLPYAWDGVAYHFFTTEQDGYLISVLTAEEALPPIQLLTIEELL